MGKSTCRAPSACSRLDDSGAPSSRLRSPPCQAWSLPQLGSNGICFPEDLEPLKGLGELRTLYLEHNPVARLSGYRETVASELPQLTQLDATSCA